MASRFQLEKGPKSAAALVSYQRFCPGDRTWPIDHIPTYQGGQTADCEDRGSHSYSRRRDYAPYIDQHNLDLDEPDY